MKLIVFLLFLVMFALVGCHSRTEDHTRGVSGICELHHSQMTKTNVPIRYGLMGYSQWALAFQAASTNNFPHADDEVLGGCLVGSDSPTQAVIYVCAQCLRAQEQWISEHPSPK
jgi:hypothetical protein